MNSESEKKYYELGFLVKEEDAAPVKNLLLKHKASFLYESQVVKVNLAYPIRKNNQAFFGYFRFEFEPAAVAELEKELKLEPSLIRHVLIKLSPAIIKELARPPAGGPPRPSVRPGLKKKETPEAAPILTNEALEKKIEEILQ